MLPPGQTASIITTVANNLQVGISDKLSPLFSSVSAILGSLVIAFAYNWVLTLVTGVGLAFIVVVYGITAPAINGVLSDVMQADIQASSMASEALSSVRMIAACGAENRVLKKFAGLVDEGRRRGKRMASLVGIQQALSKST